MPTYDYKCSNCGEIYELFQSMTDKPKKKCLKCGKNTAVRLIGGGSGLIFKGSGFYITDYRSDSYKAAAKKDSNSGGENKKKGSDSTKKSSESKTSKVD